MKHLTTEQRNLLAASVHWFRVDAAQGVLTDDADMNIEAFSRAGLKLIAFMESIGFAFDREDFDLFIVHAEEISDAK